MGQFDSSLLKRREDTVLHRASGGDEDMYIHPQVEQEEGPAGQGNGHHFLHTTVSHFHRFHCQTRSVHDTVEARLTGENIQGVKPVRQKVGLAVRLGLGAIVEVAKLVTGR
ncbi:hypothetical protein JOB18_008393 [Solea senegalensis]|uniref:Uncharacterized protein n=1 Tax=Solea senegalensis TaxID=28829 RepID=A0AAV6PVQ8_SOLSE|nr:hypothetical protein JOB18_008393 [Solea senegalensis]